MNATGCEFTAEGWACGVCVDTCRPSVVPCVSGAEFVAFVESLGLDPASLDEALEGIAVGRERDPETFRTDETFPKHDKNEARFPPLMDVVQEIRDTGFSIDGRALLAELTEDEEVGAQWTDGGQRHSRDNRHR